MSGNGHRLECQCNECLFDRSIPAPKPMGYGRPSARTIPLTEPPRPVRPHPHVVEGAWWGVFGPGEDTPMVVCATRAAAEAVLQAIRWDAAVVDQLGGYGLIPVEVTIVCPHPRGARR